MTQLETRNHTKIYKLEILETSSHIYTVGEKGVISITEDIKQISSCAETQSYSTKLIYKICFNNETIEISADTKSIVVYKK